MTRRLRRHVAGGFYHVTLRGNHRRPIFFADEDRDLLDTVVGDAAERLAARIHAYCWMTNHLHLLVQVADAPLGCLMLRIASRYAHRIQAPLATTGHLFERRYHAVLVDADCHLLAIVRYIHLNPVRAGTVTDPADYRWSSHRAYLGGPAPPWLCRAFALQLLGDDAVSAATHYRQFMHATDDSRWGEGTLKPHAQQPDILGGDDFVARVCGAAWQPRGPHSLDDLMRACGDRFRIAPEALASSSRSHHLARARAWLAHQVVAGRVTSISELARRLGRSEAAIRQVMARHRPEATGED
ncbi:MAG: transposase [Gammaproteobacteria bacterium]|nr:transposase [Gammaproteobacteria bacterium]